jgi:hypothetical protein
MRCEKCGHEIDEEFQKIVYKEKNYRIYKWEKKPFKDFVCPKGFRGVDYKEFSDLVNNTKFNWEQYPVSYYSTNLIKNNYWELTRAYLNDDGDWGSINGHLAGSDDCGRVVVVEGEKKND